MDYKIYVTKTYDGKYKLGIQFGSEYHTNIRNIGHMLQYYGILDDIIGIRDFTKSMKIFTKNSTLTFTNEESLLQAQDYLESLLVLLKFKELK